MASSSTADKPGEATPFHTAPFSYCNHSHELYPPAERLSPHHHALILGPPLSEAHQPISRIHTYILYVCHPCSGNPPLYTLMTLQSDSPPHIFSPRPSHCHPFRQHPQPHYHSGSNYRPGRHNHPGQAAAGQLRRQQCGISQWTHAGGSGGGPGCSALHAVELQLKRKATMDPPMGWIGTRP